MNGRGRLRRPAVAVCLVALVGACAGGTDGAARRPSPTPSTTDGGACTVAPRRDVAYGSDDRRQRLDVYPALNTCAAPVVVWVHGGGWQRGDKRKQMADKVRLWNDAGYAVVSVNYRLTDPSSPQPVRFPTHDEDVAAAVAWVHDHIDDVGGDPDRIAALGHSAGAQIVASIATDPRYLAAHGLGLDALRCAGALDTEGYDVAAKAPTNAIYRAAFGDAPAVWRDASPIHHVGDATGVPRFLLVERGTQRRRRAAEAFFARLREAGVPVTTVDAGSLTHGEVNSEIGRGGDAVITPPLERFLAECFSPTS